MSFILRQNCNITKEKNVSNISCFSKATDQTELPLMLLGETILAFTSNGLKVSLSSPITCGHRKQNNKS